MKVLAKLKKEPGIWMDEAPVPEIKDNEVLIKIKKTAICGTDMHIYNWDDWAQNIIPVPLITGHEFAGEIVELGKDVEGLKIGQRVSGEGHITCGYCRNCRGGTQHLCPNTINTGVQKQGVFAEYASMPAVNVYPLPDKVSDDLASIFDPFGNAVHTALSFDLVGEDVLITGCGATGAMAAAVAKFVGARHVVVTDVNEYKLDLVKKINPNIITVNPTKEDLHDTMKRLDMKEGFDVGLEMCGNPTAFNSMIDVMNCGGKISMLAFLPDDTTINWSRLVLKGLTIKGIYGREMFETWYKMTNLVLSGLDVSPIITHHYPVDDFQQGFDAMASGESGKVILEWV